jgi:Rieske Fe-S protein
LTTPDRRRFLQQISRGLVGAVAAQSAASLASACAHVGVPAAPTGSTGTVVDVSTLSTDGSSVVARVPGPDGAPILVTRVHGRLRALSLHCTHEGCPVGSTPVNGVLRCPCHGSQFDLEGNVLHGPADEPLGQYETHYDAAHHRLRINFIPST